MMVAFTDWAMRNFNGKDFIVLGFTYGTACRNVIDPWLAMTRTKQRYKCDFKESKGKMTVRRGNVTNTFYIFGADTERAFRKIQGFTAAGALIDETALCVRSAVDQALARCSVDGARFFFNCNPDAPTHWFYTDWILQLEKHNALRLHMTLDDNPGLSEATKERYKSQYSGVFRQRYIEGEWVIAEGLVYPFEREKYVVPTDVAEGGQDGTSGEYYISIDYGITNPFAALLWRLYDGVAYLVDEYYFDSRKEGSKKTDSEHYEAVEKLAGDLPIQEVIVDPSANSFKEEIWRRGRFMVRDADNAVIDGIATTMQMIDNDRLKVAARCYNFIQEMGLYVWSDKANKDEVVKAHDHAMDSCRYFVNTTLKYLIGGF